MAIKKTKEQNFQITGRIDEIKDKCHDALLSGGFKNINRNDLLNELSADYKTFTIVGKIKVVLKEDNNNVNISLQSTANTDNIFALISSPNDKIQEAFKQYLR